MRRWALLLIAGCAAKPASEPSVATCDAAMAAGVGPTTMADIAPIFEQVRRERVPELADVEITLGELSSDDSFFVANLDLATASSPPRERSYVVNANPRMFESPAPPFSAVYAILVHELKHIVDYTEMDTEELVSFGIWYATADVAEYERQTDEFALERGCAAGIKDYRVWLYARISEEAAEAKRRDYYTPEEIDAWVADHGG